MRDEKKQNKIEPKKEENKNDDKEKKKIENPDAWRDIIGHGV